jgi:hypothetical protein
MWHVGHSDGDAGDYNLEEMTRVLIDNDDLDTATRRLNRPACLLGRRIAKHFGRALHIGTITDHDTDKATGNVIWRIIFEDGDQEDLDLPQLTPLLLAACAAGTGSGSKLTCAPATGTAPPPPLVRFNIDPPPLCPAIYKSIEPPPPQTPPPPTCS